MAAIGPEDWLKAEREERRASKANLAGMYMAGPWIGLVAIASLPVMAVAGEGDYIIAVLGVMWLAQSIVALLVRRASEKGTVRRTCATWVLVWASILCVAMFLIAVAFASDGSWR